VTLKPIWAEQTDMGKYRDFEEKASEGKTACAVNQKEEVK
jgi:hypothetical protein